MEGESVALPEPLIDTDPAPPAPGADEQKPTDPPSDADARKPEETPEQQEAKRESRRARSNARKAAELAEARTEARLYREALERERQAKQPESGEPKREQFEDYETYLRAVAKYDAKQEASATLKTEREARQGSEQQSRANVERERHAQAWIKREQAFQTETKDYDEVVKEYVESDLGLLSDETRRAIIESEVGPQVLYYLGKNPDVADRIAGLTPLRQVVELGKLEDKLDAPPVKKASNAPAPIKPVGQGRSASLGISDNDSQAEYESKRKAQGARWAR